MVQCHGVFGSQCFKITILSSNTGKHIPSNLLQHPSRTNTSMSNSHLSVTQVTIFKKGFTMMSNVSHLTFRSNTTFQHNTWALWYAYPILAWVKKFYHGTNCFYIHSHWQTATSTSFLQNQQPPMCCFTGSNCSKTDVIWGVKWCTLCLIAWQETSF